MSLRVGLGQFNASVGDIAGNVKIMRRFYEQAVKSNVDILVFPEMAVCGYPPEDLLLKNHFLEENRLAVEQLAKDCPKKTVIVGFAEAGDKGFFNSLAVLEKGQIKKIYRKCILPNYGVFDERRYFRPGTGTVIVNVNGMAVVLTICEDIWHLEWMDKFLKEIRCKDIIINISASPFYVGKLDKRQEVLRHCATYFDCAVAYCNLVGGQDELVFDGRSMFLDSTGAVICQAKAFDEDLLIADIDLADGKRVMVKSAARQPMPEPMATVAEVYGALVLGTRDYILKNSFGKVVIGLSGGIDSALTAAIAVDALGAQNVLGITMPSKFNSPDTISDAEKVAKNLDIEFRTIPIASVLNSFNDTLSMVEGWEDCGIAYENLQARIRGTILMSLSNRFSYMVLTTGNKSETAVGYSTLYGDSAGGFAVIKDVPKTMVYDLARYMNKINNKELIPQSVIDRIPSAELKEGQKDTDSLPEYDLLDRIIKGYIEDDKSPQELIKEGLPGDVVKRVVRMIDINEYKRRQSPPGVKITPRAFGKDRRMPITNCYTSQ
ncbi:MAG: NAD+ synthase [Planctomycetota bacterium]|nr:NAD+ synthase [Planctomycetota bacterium]